MKPLPVTLVATFIVAGLTACEQPSGNQNTEQLVPRDPQVLEQLPAEVVFARVARLYPDKRVQSFAECADYHREVREAHKGNTDYDAAKCFAPNSGTTIRLEGNTAMIPTGLNATLK